MPEQFLDAILLDLRKAGFIASKRGPDGGHWLARDPSRVTVGAIIEAIDGPLVSPGEPSLRRRPSSPADRALQAFWGRVVTSVHTVVDTVTLEDLRHDAGSDGPLDFTI